MDCMQGLPGGCRALACRKARAGKTAAWSPALPWRPLPAVTIQGAGATDQRITLGPETPETHLLQMAITPREWLQLGSCLPSLPAFVAPAAWPIKWPS